MVIDNSQMVATVHCQRGCIQYANISEARLKGIRKRKPSTLLLKTLVFYNKRLKILKQFELFFNYKIK